MLGRNPRILKSGETSSHNQEAKELGQIALEQIRYMEDILSDMLTFSRPDALSREWISVDKLLDGAIGVSQKKIEQSGARIFVDIQAGLPTLYVGTGQ